MNNLCILIQKLVDDVPVQEFQNAHQVVDLMVELWDENHYLSYIGDKYPIYKKYKESIN